MKCPKCGYISFDYNQVCPKCNKDISSEQAKLNIPPFQPNPPSLLGALTGDVNESQIGLQVDTSAIFEETVVEDMGDASVEETGEFSFDNSQDADISLGGMEGLDVFGETGESEIDFEGLDETELAEKETVADFDLETDSEEEFSQEKSVADLSMEPREGTDEELSLDLGSLSDEEAETLQKPSAEMGGIGAEDLTLELSKASIDEAFLHGAQEAEAPEAIDLGLDEMSLEEPFETRETDESELKFDEIFLEEEALTAESDDSKIAKIESETGIDLEALDELELEIEPSEKAREKQDEVELNLDDLKVNETGELEIGTQFEIPETSEQEEPEKILLEDQAREQAQQPLAGIEFEEIPVEEEPTLWKTTSDPTAQGLEDTMIGLEEISLSEEPISETGESELVFDLENLDLDLDFEDDSEDDKKEK